MQKSFSREELKDLAIWLWQEMQGHKVIALHGPMGVGKTTLVQAVCNYLQVEDTVGSPTFSIINEYQYEQEGSPKNIYHIDLYRLKDEAEAIRAGVEDCLYSGNLCLVEWPERAPEIFPEDTLHVFISLENDDNRSIKIQGK